MTLKRRYRLTRPIGPGGQLLRWSAVQRILEKECVAVQLADSSDAATMDAFRRAVLAASRIAHPNVASIVDADFDAEEPWFVLNESPSQPRLKELIETENAPVYAACSIVIAVMAAVEAAHDVGVLHQGILPACIRVASRDAASVSGFAAAPFRADPANPAHSVSVRARRYLPPAVELFDRPDAYQAAHDRYAVGALACHIFTGIQPTVQEAPTADAGAVPWPVVDAIAGLTDLKSGADSLEAAREAVSAWRADLAKDESKRRAADAWFTKNRDRPEKYSGAHEVPSPAGELRQRALGKLAAYRELFGK